MIGRKIGRFRVLEKLGQGGMASVWKAHDELLKRDVALKVLEGAAAESQKGRRRFQHEAESQAKLDHPCIATIHESGESDGIAYIAMAYVDGETASNRVARNLLPIPDVIRTMRDTAGALDHAHGRGVVHRDITGRNVLLKRDGTVVLVDFGLALVEGASRLTTQEKMLGTIAYMAPEVLTGRTEREQRGPHSADARTDIYGLGAVTYELLTGRLPFVSDRQEALIYAIPNVNVEPPSLFRPETPPELERIILKAMAKAPAERYQAAADLVCDLDLLQRESQGVSDSQHTQEDTDPPRVLPDSRNGEHLGTAAAITTPLESGGPIYLAVLPFRRDKGHDAAELEQLARGIEEVLSAQLAGLPNVRVVQAAPDEFADSDSLRKCADRLGVNVLLTGTLRVSGARVRASFALVYPLDGSNLYGDTIDGSLVEPFLLEEQIAASARSALGGVRDTERSPGSSPHRDPGAPEHFEQARRYLARNYSEASVDGAIGILGRLLETEGDSAAIHASLSRAFLMKYEHTSQRVWQSRAASSCERAIELEPDRLDVLLAQAALHSIAGRRDEALREYDRALEEQPDHMDALYGYAKAAVSRARLEDAERICRRAIDRWPDDWRGHVMLGVVCYQSGRLDQAVDCWEKVVALTPDNANAYRNLGAALFRLGRREESMRALERAIEILPNAVSYGNLGSVLFFSRQYDDALRALETAARMNPSNPLWWGNLGSVHRQMPGHEVKAATALDRAISLIRERLERDPDDAHWWGRLGGWLANRGEFDSARDAIARAFEISPEQPDTLLRAGYVHFQAGDRREALRWFRRAAERGYGLSELELDPELEPLREDPEFRSLLAGPA